MLPNVPHSGANSGACQILANTKLSIGAILHLHNGVNGGMVWWFRGMSQNWNSSKQSQIESERGATVDAG